MVLPEDRYNFSVRAKDRVCVAITDRECLAGEKLELPPFKLIDGGFISGQVVNTSTGQSIAVTDKENRSSSASSARRSRREKWSPPRGWRPWIAPVGSPCGRPRGRTSLTSSIFTAIAWRGTRPSNQPIVVKEGETTSYNMLVTPRIPPAEKLEERRGNLSTRCRSSRPIGRRRFSSNSASSITPSMRRSYGAR